MGSRGDVSDLLAACRWAEEGSYLGEVARSPGFPILVKVSRGVYQGVGQPSFANPTLVSHLLLVSAGKQLSVAAQCVKFKNQRSRVVPFGPTLVIPKDFQGHFEILSEDGRSVPALQTVESLSRKFPDSCLVREAIKGYKPEVSKDSALISPEGEKLANYKISDKSRVIQPGEVLVLVGEVTVPSGKSKVTRYLRCFDSKGQTVYLNASQKGKFSPLAREDSIGGVHTTKNILNKRMPMMVRVVDGKPPLNPLTNKSSFKFVPELRLFTTIQEELVFGLPLSQNSKDSSSILPLPLSVPLKFQVCRNMGQVEQMKEFSRIHEKLKILVEEAKNLIQVYDINLKKELRFDGRQWKAYAPPIFLSSSNPLLSTTANDPVPGTPTRTTTYEIPDVQDYEDIDEIYDYVRGIKPAASAPHVPTGGTTVVTLNQDAGIIAVEGTTSILIGSANVISVGPNAPRPVRLRALSADSPEPEERKPEPPPIETIPSRLAGLAQVQPLKSDRNRRNLHRSHGVCGKVTMMVTSGNASTGSSPNNTGTSGDSLAEPTAPSKHRYVKKHAQIPPVIPLTGSTANILESANGGLLSGSPTNRLIFRRSPIFDCRYKSMNDLNRSSLESGASGSSHKHRYFQHNQNALNVNPHHPNHSHSSSNLNANPNLKGGNSGRSKGIFRPKSLTNILAMDEPNPYRNVALRGSRREMVMPNHVHHAQPPPLDILQKFSQSQRLRRSVKPPPLYL